MDVPKPEASATDAHYTYLGAGKDETLIRPLARTSFKLQQIFRFLVNVDGVQAGYYLGQYVPKVDWSRDTGAC